MKNIVMLFPIILLCGCGLAAEEKEITEPETAQEAVMVNSDVVVDAKTAYELNILQDYNLALYEPPSGCYIGGYILSNKKVDYDIEKFEELVEKKHAIYAYNMKVGDKFPVNWILSCISNMKTPLIVLKPGADPFDEQALEEAAKEFSEFYVPMFVQLYPVDKVYDKDRYVKFFRRARGIFREHASNVSLVWGAEGDFVYGAGEYYPGDEWVDWVGLSMLQSANGSDPDTEVLKLLDHFYYRFQKVKPIMITGLGVSHFSSMDHAYRTSPAALVLVETYRKIADEYPRVKAVCYMDFNGVTIPSERVVRENFSITDDEKKLEAYKSAISDEKFLSEINISDSGDLSRETIRSPFRAYKIGNDFYISAKSFTDDMKLNGVGSFSDPKYIDGELYYNYDVITRNRIGTVSIDRNRKTILVGQ